MATALTDWRHSFLSHNLHVASGPGWLSLYAGDSLKLHLNEKHFLSSPRLAVSKQGEVLNFALSNARLPGSYLFADMIGELWPGALGMQAHLKLPGLGLEFVGAVRDWFGTTGLITELPRALPYSNGRAAQIVFQPGAVRLRDGAVLHFQGGARASLHEGEVRLDADQAELRSWTDRSGEEEVAVSKIVLQRGARPWHHALPKGSWHYEEEKTLFDKAVVEAYEDRRGEQRVRSELTRSRMRPTTAVSLSPNNTQGPIVTTVSLRNLNYSTDSATSAHRVEAQLGAPIEVAGSEMALRLTEPMHRPALLAERSERQQETGSIVANGTLALKEFADVFFDTPPSWSVRIDCASSDVSPLGDAEARLLMVQSKVSLEGSLKLRIIRPVDGLDIPLCITNVDIALDGMLLRLGRDQSQLSLLIVDLPSQVFLTPAIPNSNPNGGDDVALPSCGPFSRLAAPTRLSFQFLNAENTQRELTLKSLLRWADYRLHVAPQLVAPKSVPLGSAVPEYATQMVVPGGLTISPDQDHAFYASEDVHGDPKTHTYQLWQARATRRPKQDDYADFGSDFPVVDELRPCLFVLNARTLGALPTGATYGYTAAEYGIIASHLETSAAKARYLRLSNRGAWLDISQKWPLDASDSTSFHTRVGGQLEQLEEITFEGICVPTGHRVVVQQTTALQWCRNKTTGLLVTGFVQRFKIVYQQPTVDYTSLRNKAIKAGTEQLPFNQITLCGKESEFLDISRAAIFVDQTDPRPTDYWAWVDEIQGAPAEPFSFPLDCVDVNGVVHHTVARMLVAKANVAYESGYSKQVTDAYNTPPSGIDTSLDFLQSRVGYAVETRRGDTSFPTGLMHLQALVVPGLSGAAATQGLPWYPVMADTSLSLEQVAAFGTTPTPQKFVYSSVYKNEPFDYMTGTPTVNKAEIILQLPAGSKPAGLKYQGQLGGGLALPNTGVQALARRTGAVLKNASDTVDSTLTDAANGILKIADIFKDASAVSSLLGAVSLSDILDQAYDATTQAASVPLLALRQIHAVEDSVVSEVRGYLSKLLSYEQTIVSTAQQYVTEAKTLQTELVRTVGLVASLGRVLLSERQPVDVKALEGKIYFQPVGGGAAQDLIASLEKKLVLSATQRVLAATALPLEATPAVLPTLYQYRDYACNQLAAEATAAADTLISGLEQTILDLQGQAQQTLENALSAATSVAADFTSFFMFQLANALANLNSTLSGTVDTDTLVDLADNIETVRQYIALVPQWKSQWQTLKGNLLQDIPTSVNGIQGALKQASAQVNTFLDGACPNGSPTSCSTLRDNLKQAINNDIPAQFQNTSITQAVQLAVATATNTFQQFETDFDNALAQFLTAVDEIESDLDAIRDLLQIPRQVVASFDYDVPLNSTSLFIAQRNGQQAQLSLHASVTLNLDGTPPNFDVEVEVDSFQLLLIPSAPFVLVGIDHVRFTSHNGAKPTVSCPVGLGDIQFIGPLDFVAGLAEELGLGDGLIAALSPTGVELGIAIPLPPIEVGAFDMVGLNVSTAVRLSFTGAPLRLVFGFATPNQHFIMTYLFLGGGGFINLEFTPTDMSQMSVTAALEAGAMLALDFGVADGEVHAFAGFYMQISQGLFLLSGYYRCGGELDVLGLISASVEFSMALTYEDRNGHAWLSGECDLVIDVHVFLFSASVSLHMQHDFSGTGGS
jgi:hypothetical protein